MSHIFLNGKVYYGITVIVYVVLALYLLPHYQYQINPDGICYITIAQKYLHGDFWNAINGYWGPMISWLLVPFLFLKMAPLYAVKLQTLLIGLITLVGLNLLLSRFDINRPLKLILLFFSTPILLYFAVFAITPDIHIVCTLIYYFIIIFDPNYPNRISNGILCGLMGGLAYLSKSYAFPFFITHFILLNVFHYYKTPLSQNRLKVLKNLAWGLLVFMVISGCWIGMISQKYKTLTIGMAGAGNYKLLMNPQSETILEGFHRPTNDTAISVHEDPSYMIFKAPSWNIIESFHDFKHYIKIVLKNLSETKKIMTSSYPLILTILVASLLLNAYALNKSYLHYNTNFPLITIFLYLSGYILILIEERYIWIILILFYTMGGSLLNLFLHHKAFHKRWQIVVIPLFILSFVIHPMVYLLDNTAIHKGVYDLSHHLSNQYHIKGNIASDTCLELSLAISFYLDSKYYCTTKKNIKKNELISDLKKYGIDYYFSWQENSVIHELPFPSKEIQFEGFQKLRIFKVTGIDP